MPFPSRTRWMRVPIVLLLLAMLVPVATISAPVTPAVAQTSGSPCSGDPHADYADQCGPSLTIPAWSDAADWNNQEQAGTITLIDIDDDGKDELIGRGPQGLEVNRWSDAWGQWAPATNLIDARPFPIAEGDILGPLLFGQLADGMWGAVGIIYAPSEPYLQTWAWNPGEVDVPGSGYWTLLNSSGPLASDSFPGADAAQQFVPVALEGAGYGYITRESAGISFCSWQTGANEWSCKSVGSAFNDSVMTDANGNLADYLYDTLQFGDIYPGTPGPELFGRDNLGGSVLKVYGWDSAAQQFTELKPSGSWPFWSPNGEWNDVKYSSTIQPVQLLGSDQSLQVIGRGLTGLQWFAISDSGCGGHTAPCWKNLTNNPTQLYSDFAGFNDPQYYSTIQFADIDGDGIDETFARTPDGKLHTYALHKSAGWGQITGDLSLTAGPSSDPLWSNATYYETIAHGVVTDDQRAMLIARGKYGVRTWMYWSNSGWNRPYAYGFQPFTTAEQNAYDLASSFVGLNPNTGTSIRTQYSANVASSLAQYQDCLADSLGQPMPPAEVCITEGGGTLSNDNNVTAAQWESMATLLISELHAAHGLTQYMTNVNDLITDEFFYESGSFDTELSTLFPSNKPGNEHNVNAMIFNLFVGFGEAASIVAGPAAAGVNSALHIFSAIFGSMESMQTPNDTNTRAMKVEEVQTHITTATSEALSTQTALYQYIAADMGLLQLYGAMTNQGFWDLTGDRQNAAVSTADYHTTNWIFQTMTPVYWQVYVCEPGTGSHGDANSCEANDIHSIELGTNASYVTDPEYPDITWITLLGDADVNAISPTGYTGALFQKVFGGNAGGCVVGDTDPSSAWNTSCNLGLDIGFPLYFAGNWFWYTCTVLTTNSDETYQCGQALPNGYPPGDSLYWSYYDMIEGN